MITLQDAAENPRQLWTKLTLEDEVSLLYRPLEKHDDEALAAFLESLSQNTRDKWLRDGYDKRAAQEMCDAIARYDKLRMIAVNTCVQKTFVIALYEFSFDIPESDRVRFESYGIKVSEDMDCRFGPCLRDEYQGRGIGTALMAPTFQIARLFGRRRILLWGGVHADNDRAIAFYQKNGFYEVGRFKNSQGKECIDMMCDLSL